MFVSDEKHRDCHQSPISNVELRYKYRLQRANSHTYHLKRGLGPTSDLAYTPALPAIQHMGETSDSSKP